MKSTLYTKKATFTIIVAIILFIIGYGTGEPRFFIGASFSALSCLALLWFKKEALIKEQNSD